MSSFVLPDELEAESEVRSVESGCRWGSWRVRPLTAQSQHTRELRNVEKSPRG